MATIKGFIPVEVEIADPIKKEFTISSKYRSIILMSALFFGILTGTQSVYAGLGVFLLIIIYWFYLTSGKHFAFTNKRIILVDSFLGKNIKSIDFGQITDIEVQQSFIEQLAGWGTLLVNTAGTHSSKIHVSFIDNPIVVKKDLDQIRYAKKEVVKGKED